MGRPVGPGLEHLLDAVRQLGAHGVLQPGAERWRHELQRLLLVLGREQQQRRHLTHRVHQLRDLLCLGARGVAEQLERRRRDERLDRTRQEAGEPARLDGAVPCLMSPGAGSSPSLSLGKGSAAPAAAARGT